MMFRRLVLAALALISASTVLAASDEFVVLTVAYCPDVTTGRGATVRVDVNTGAFSILSTFNWPDAILGCVADYTPTIASGGSSGGGGGGSDSPSVLLNFSELADGTMIELDVLTGVLNVSTVSDSEFVGFTSMYLDASRAFVGGLQPTANLQCPDGCFEFGTLTLGQPSSTWTPLQNIPFRALIGDAHLFDSAAQRMWVQASYDLRPDGSRCAPRDSDLCLVAVDTASGGVVSSVFTNFTVYAWGGGQAKRAGWRTVWMQGFDDICQHPYNNFAFGYVDLATAAVTLQACMPRTVTVHSQEWVAAFNHDSSLLVTASGNATGANSQLLLLRAHDGSVQLNTPLIGLGEALGAWNDLVWVWAVAFENSNGVASSHSIGSRRLQRIQKR